MTHVDLAVVGGGITGLAAAWEAKQRGADVVLLEASSTAGGKLRTSPLAGVPLDESADAFLARVPEAVTLCTEVGIADELVAPAAPGRAYVFAHGELRALPDKQLLGVPTDLDALATSGLVSAEGVVRARKDLTRPDDRPDGDEPVGDLIRRRLGEEVLDTLVAPLVGGIWAGNCDHLSLATATPALYEARQRGPSLVRAAAELRAEAERAAASDRPVFLTPRGGMVRLVEALVDKLDDAVRTDSPVTGIARSHGRWRLDPLDIAADGVVLAVPAYSAAKLVGRHCPAAAATLEPVYHASVALVALAVRRDGIEHPLDGSGFLVPPSSGRLLTACSWSTSKWPHLDQRDGVALLRASAGRDGDDRASDLSDETLVAQLLDDLRDTMGLHGRPAEMRVSRWTQSFPQPRPGHLDRVTRLEEVVARDAPGLALAGAWARGVGIPACIRSGRDGAARALRVQRSRTS